MKKEVSGKLISVIVPVYRVEEYLPKCIESLTNQTYKNLEVILVDDGSPDNSGKICDEYAKKDKRIRVIHKENGGVSSARNLGIENAKGEFITFVDGDDYLEPSMYEKLICKQAESDSDLVFCRFKQVYSDKTIYVNEDSLEKFCREKNLSVLFNNSTESYYTDSVHHLKDYVMCSIWRVLFKASLAKKYRFNTGLKIMEDKAFLTEILVKEDCKISYVDEYLYNYLMRQGSALHQKNNYVVENSKNLVSEFERIFADTKYSEIVKGLKFYLYSECVIQKHVNGLKIKIADVKEWNKRENYKAFRSTKMNKKAKVKYFVIRHGLSSVLKALYYFNDKTK